MEKFTNFTDKNAKEENIVPISHFHYFDIVDNPNDFVCIEENELIVVTGFGLRFYNYKDHIVHYSFDFGELYAVELLDDTYIAFSGKINDAYRLVLFDYKAKEIADMQTITFEAIKIKKINDTLLACVGYGPDVLFYHYKERQIVHSQPTTDHEGNIKRKWIQTVEIVDDEVVVYGGSDCKLSFFNHKTMAILYEVSRPGWIRDIEVFEDKLVATDGGSDKFAIWDYSNKKYIYNEKIRIHELKYICYLGDGDLIFGQETPSLLNYKTQTLNEYCTLSELKDIQKRVQALTSVTENRFCYKKGWLKKQLRGVPRTSAIRKLIVLESGNFLIVLKRHMILFDNEQKNVVWHIELGFYVHEVIYLDESHLAFISTGQNLIIYDFNEKKIVFGNKIINVTAICKLDDKLLAYATDDEIFTLNYKTYKNKNVSCFVMDSITDLCRTDDQHIASRYQWGVCMCNIKTREKVLKLYDTMDIFPPSESLRILDDEKIAIFDYFTVYIKNYKNGDTIKTIKLKNCVKKLLRLNDEILIIIERDDTLTYYNYKQNSIEDRGIDLPYEASLKDTIVISDTYTAIHLRDTIFIYEDIWGESRCTESVRIYDETILSLYEYEKNQLTLINTQENFLDINDAYFDYYAKFIDLKSKKIISYKALPQRVYFDENKPKQLILK